MGSVFLLLPQKPHSIGVERHLDADTVKWQWSQGKSFLYFLLMWRTYLSHRWGYCIFFCTAMLWCYRGQKNTGWNWLCKTSLAVILQTWGLIMCKTRMWYQQVKMSQNCLERRSDTFGYWAIKSNRQINAYYSRMSIFIVCCSLAFLPVMAWRYLHSKKKIMYRWWIESYFVFWSLGFYSCHYKSNILLRDRNWELFFFFPEYQFPVNQFLGIFCLLAYWFNFVPPLKNFYNFSSVQSWVWIWTLPLFLLYKRIRVQW